MAPLVALLLSGLLRLGDLSDELGLRSEKTINSFRATVRPIINSQYQYICFTTPSLVVRYEWREFQVGRYFTIIKKFTWRER